MKHTIIYRLVPAILAALAWAFTGCTDRSTDIPGAGEEGYLTLTLSSSSAQSRAGTLSEDLLHENLIATVHLFFYPAGSTDTDQPVYETTVSPSATSSATVNILLDKVSDLFGPDGTTCEAFAVANLPESALGSDHSRSGLKNTVITSQFDTNSAQTSFVMSGACTVTLDRVKNSASGTINLKRTAAKIIVAVELSETVTDDNGEEWRSDHTQMYISMAHGVNKSTVVAEPAITGADAKYTIPISTKDGHKFSHNDDKPAEPNGKTYACEQAIPFYTYPNQWTPSDTDRPYITLMVPWYKTDEGGASAQYCYYQIPLNRNGGDTCTFESNNIYRINISVDKLGRFVPNEPLELDGMSMEVVDWGTASTDVEITDYRYLVFNETNFVMNNENEITIPFFSSHDVEFGNVELNYLRYNEQADGTPVTHTVSPTENLASRTDANDPRSGIYDITVDNEKNTLTFYHDLKKTWTWSETQQKYTPNTEDAYSPYTITITVYHNDKEPGDKDYSQKITLTQYPAMYIQVASNTWWDRTFINDNNEDNNYADRDKWGDPHNFGYWNPDWSTRRRLGRLGGNNADYYLGSIRKQNTSSSNSNYNNYTITITKLNTSDNYKIADPRQDKINNRLEQLLKDDGTIYKDTSRVAFWSVAAPSLYDFTSNEYIYDNNKQNRLLAYYYPSDESSTKERFIAPQITVASSKGVTQPVNKVGARRRCASYQENGRPAGRWRIPTTGEVEYIVKLSSSGNIPLLFTNGSAYWTASGQIVPSESNGGSVSSSNNSTAYVRCVYDEWYWKDKTENLTTFTWGDAPIDDPQNPENSTNP